MGWEKITDLKFIQFLTMDNLKEFKHYLSEDLYMVNEGDDDSAFQILKKGVLCGFAMYLYEANNQLYFFPVTSSNIMFGTDFNNCTRIRDKECVIEILEELEGFNGLETIKQEMYDYENNEGIKKRNKGTN
jgi:hypothetical protein